MVKWEQSGIRSNVSPKFNEAAKIVARGSTPYKTINDLNTKLPAEFSGSVAITSTLNGLDACHSGAEALPGLMNDIANGMTLGDSKSYADLFSKFQAAQQGFAKAKFGADFFDTHEYSPTEQEIEKMIAAGVDPNMVGDGTAITTPYPERLAPLSNNGWDQFCTGAKTVGYGLASGFFGFFGDTIGGAGAMVWDAFGMHEEAYRWTKDWDWGGAIDAFARDQGVNTDSLLYTGAKVTGQLGANGLVLAIPGVGQQAVLANATMYSCQSYAQNYRGSIEDYLAQNNIQAPRSGSTSQLNEAVKHITPEMYKNASGNAACHATLTFATTFLTGTKEIPQMGTPASGILGNAGTTLQQKMGLEFGLHSAASYLHQRVDVEYGRKKDVDAWKMITAGGEAAIATYAVRPESKQATRPDPGFNVEKANGVVSALSDNKVVQTIGTFVNKTSTMLTNSKNSNGFVSLIGKGIDAYVGDGTGGQHSFSYALYEKIVETILK